MSEAVAKKSKKSKSSKPKVVEEVKEEVVAPVPESEPVSSTRSRRRKPTKEEVLFSCGQLIEELEAEIEATRLDKKRDVPIRVFRSFIRHVKEIRSDVNRLVRSKRVVSENSSSGFKKPVKISKQLAKFTGWDPSELRSRAEVNRFLCDYIKEHNLQNPENRQQILADKKLSKLLNYNSETDPQLTYCTMQSHIQPHFL